MVHIFVEQHITEVNVMINDETKRKLRELGLDEFIQALDDQDIQSNMYGSLSFDERLNVAIDSLYCRKNATRAKRLLKFARLRYPSADITTMYYEGRGIDRNQILELSAGNYFCKPRNIVINGFTGSGKTHLACALGKDACRHLYRTRYMRATEMFELMNLAEHEGSGISKIVTKISNYHLLIIDEWLMEPPSEKELKYLLEIFEKRHDKWPTILCTQYKISEWHPRLGGGVIADAIMDRIVHNADVVNTGNYNMREFLASHPI